MDEFENSIPDHEPALRTNGSQLITKAFSVGAIDSLKDMVLNFYKNGERKYYSILVDGETVVPKNCDGRKFDRYRQFLNQHTNMVEVRMYQGISPNCNKHQFLISKSLTAPLSGVDIEKEVDKKVAAIQREKDFENLKEQVEQKDARIRELEAVIASSPKLMETLREVLKDGSAIVSQIFSAVNSKPLAGTPQPQAEVEVELAGQAITPEQQWFNDLLQTYGTAGIKDAMGWLQRISEYPELKERIKEEIKNEIKNEIEKNGEA